MYDVVIKNGTVVDGTRLPRVVTDVGITGGRVAKIGRIDDTDGAPSGSTTSIASRRA
jgi:N-acyl-D-aspartate/D-glutamate deacylase